MAKKSKIAKNEQRKIVVDTLGRAPRRAEGDHPRPPSSEDERAEAQAALQRLPRDASPVRLRNRDAADGRPRGHLRKFGLSRVRVREMAHRGELPGVHKSSW